LVYDISKAIIFFNFIHNIARAFFYGVGIRIKKGQLMAIKCVTAVILWRQNFIIFLKKLIRKLIIKFHKFIMNVIAPFFVRLTVYGSLAIFFVTVPFTIGRPCDRVPFLRCAQTATVFYQDNFSQPPLVVYQPYVEYQAFSTREENQNESQLIEYTRREPSFFRFPQPASSMYHISSSSDASFPFSSSSNFGLQRHNSSFFTQEDASLSCFPIPKYPSSIWQPNSSYHVSKPRDASSLPLLPKELDWGSIALPVPFQKKEPNTFQKKELNTSPEKGPATYQDVLNSLSSSKRKEQGSITPFLSKTVKELPAKINERKTLPVITECKDGFIIKTIKKSFRKINERKTLPVITKCKDGFLLKTIKKSYAKITRKRTLPVIKTAHVADVRKNLQNLVSSVIEREPDAVARINFQDLTSFSTKKEPKIDPKDLFDPNLFFLKSLEKEVPKTGSYNIQLYMVTSVPSSSYRPFSLHSFAPRTTTPAVLPRLPHLDQLTGQLATFSPALSRGQGLRGSRSRNIENIVNSLPHTNDQLTASPSILATFLATTEEGLPLMPFPNSFNITRFDFASLAYSRNPYVNPIISPPSDSIMEKREEAQTTFLENLSNEGLPSSAEDPLVLALISQRDIVFEKEATEQRLRETKDAWAKCNRVISLQHTLIQHDFYSNEHLRAVENVRRATINKNRWEDLKYQETRKKKALRFVPVENKMHSVLVKDHFKTLKKMEKAFKELEDLPNLIQIAEGKKKALFLFQEKDIISYTKIHPCLQKLIPNCNLSGTLAEAKEFSAFFEKHPDRVVYPEEFQKTLKNYGVFAVTKVFTRAIGPYYLIKEIDPSSFWANLTKQVLKDGFVSWVGEVSLEDILSIGADASKSNEELGEATQKRSRLIEKLKKACVELKKTEQVLNDSLQRIKTAENLGREQLNILTHATRENEKIVEAAKELIYPGLLTKEERLQGHQAFYIF